MKKLVTGIMFGALLSTSAFSQAATRVDTKAVTITYKDGNRRAQWDIELLAAADGHAYLGLNTLNQQLRQITAWSDTRGPAEVSAQHYSVFQIDVHDGYKVSNLSLQGGVSGRHFAYWMPGEQPGYAENSADLRWSVNTATGMTSRSAVSEQFMNYGMQQFNSEMGALNYGNSFDLAFNGWTWAYAQSSPKSVLGAAAMADAGMWNTQLRIDFAPVAAPVPEPTTGAMLLGGLAVLAVAARRRSRQG